MTSGRTHIRFTVVGKSLLSIPVAARRYDMFRLDPSRDRAQLAALNLDAVSEPQFLMSASRELVAALRSDSKALIYILQEFPRYLTQLDGSFDQLLGRLSSKSRSTVRRKVRRFARECGDEEVRFRHYRSAGEMAEFIALAVPLAQVTYQARLFDGALPDGEDFAKEATVLASRGLARGYLLFAGAKPVAYLYAPQEGDRLIYSYVGFDPAFGHLSPGTVLQYKVLEQLFAEKPVRYFDYTEGEGDHKALLATDRVDCCDVLCVPDRLRWRLLLAAHRSWNAAIEIIRSSFNRLGVLSGLRRWMRRRSTA